MKKLSGRMVPGLVGRYLGRLRFPALFVLTALLFAVNVVVPDPIPFVDEIILALVGLMLGALRERDRANGGEGEGHLDERGGHHDEGNGVHDEGEADRHEETRDLDEGDRAGADPNGRND